MEKIKQMKKMKQAQTTSYKAQKLDKQAEFLQKQA